LASINPNTRRIYPNPPAARILDRCESSPFPVNHVSSTSMNNPDKAKWNHQNGSYNHPGYAFSMLSYGQKYEDAQDSSNIYLEESSIVDRHLNVHYSVRFLNFY
jgi:hypothetical protein